MSTTSAPTTAPLDLTRLPRHVAIIMDGNGRWAKARGLDRSQGHVEGVNTVRRITTEASHLGIGHITLYTFSTENWKRPQAEVDSLMELIGIAIEREVPALIEHNVRLNIIGDMERVPEQPRRRLEEALEATVPCTGLQLNLAISYSGRWDIAQAARQMAHEVKRGALQPADITEDTLASLLSTCTLPDPDLLIRTGGELRVSNFLLWEIAYSEIICTPTLWPDYSEAEFRRALAQYQRRERRFGMTSDQVSDQ